MNVALRSIKNKRVVLALAPKRWPNNLPPPVFATDTDNKARAVSLLRGIPMRDGEAVYPSDLTASQARDVVKHLSPPRWPESPRPSRSRRSAGFLLPWSKP